MRQNTRDRTLVIDGRFPPVAKRRWVLDSFQPVSPAAANLDETHAQRRYRNPALGFSIEPPGGARVTRDGDDNLSFAVLGPENEAASEISDGFTLTIVRDTDNAAPTLDAYAEAVRPDGAPSAHRVRVGGQTALRYASQSELGGMITHWLFRPADGVLFQVSATVSGPARDYREQINAMLVSLRFDSPN